MNPTVLVVEDEAAIADTVLYALKTEGLGAERAGTGAEALEILSSGRISLVVLDVGLPDRNGFDLCKEMRARFPVPVIFLTARADVTDRVVGLEIGADDYMVKPFSPRELTARVRAVLRRAGGPAAPDAAPGARFPFRVDENRRAISYFGKPLDLSRYEYRILKTLIGHPGWVYSREKLMGLTWEEPEASYERTVDSHVKGLRAKLRQVRPEPDPILTHRGEGYSLREDW